MNNLDETIIDFYQGFEDEPEIQFITNHNGTKTILKMWNGYFNNIMNAIEPDPDGWHGLAYYFHLVEGWYDTSPWEIPDKNEAYEQLKTVNVRLLGTEEVKVLDAILSILDDAIKQKELAWIEYD